MKQPHLLLKRRFAPFFWAQAFGAFNDNLFKNALVIMITFKAVTLWGLTDNKLVSASAGIFILPFFLFSASAGQLADKYNKARLMRWVKAWEVLVMSIAAWAFVTDRFAVLMAVLFLMGLQSAFFGPAKYAVLPELLTEDELVTGNALVQMGTFLAILLGTIAGGMMIAIEQTGPSWLAASVFGVAMVGWLCSLLIPATQPASPDLRIALNPVTPMWETFKATRQNLPIFRSILGVSWFWFWGASFLTVLPGYAKEVMRGSSTVVTLLLALFSVGIAIGSMLCARLSRRHLELGLVPIGSIGMTLFAGDLFLVGDPGFATSAGAQQVGQLLATFDGVRIAIDFSGIAISGGIYIVPLQTMIQQRSPTSNRSRVIAGNNILNALFMVLSAVMLLSLQLAGFGAIEIFLVLALLNAAVAIYVYTVVPEFLLRFVAWAIANVMYRMRIDHDERLPSEGPAVIVCNHVSFVDWLLVAAATHIPVRFVMYAAYAKIPVIRTLLRDAKVIPIAPAHEDPQALSKAFGKISEELQAGEIVCIFPEGKLTPDGTLQPFRKGIEKIIARDPAPVIPIAIQGMWGSFFSRKDGPLKKPFRRVWSRVHLTVLEPIPAEQVNAQTLEERIAEALHEPREKQLGEAA